jgi:hypothetical protein
MSRAKAMKYIVKDTVFVRLPVKYHIWLYLWKSHILPQKFLLSKYDVVASDEFFVNKSVFQQMYKCSSQRNSS